MPDTPPPVTPTAPPVFQRIMLCRDKHGLEIEEVTPTDGINFLAIGATTYQATVPVPVDAGGQMPVTVLIPEATNLAEAFAMLHDRQYFLPRLQAAAQAKGEMIQRMQARGPKIQMPMPGLHGR